MEIIFNGFLFLFGLFLLIFGSNYLIQSSVKFAHIFRLTSVFVGLVLVAFGTSCPEAGISIVAAVKGYKGIALGNIIGSCIANIGLVLGFCAFLFPLAVDKDIFKRELPIMFLATALFYLLGLDLVLNRLDGFILLFFFIVFIFLSCKKAKTSFIKSSGLKDLTDFKFRRIFKKINTKFAVGVLFIFFLVLVILGANLMVISGVALAKIFEINSWIISITVFAIGTSLPELAVSFAASFKKIPSISVGNVIGSNIFNILFILGIISLIKPINIQVSVLKFEFPILFLFSAFLLTIIKTKYKIIRSEGLVMLAGYLTFIFFLIRR